MSELHDPMSELHEGLHRLADRAGGGDAGVRMTDRLGSLATRVRRRRAARAAGTSVAVVGVVAAVGLGAMALADRDPAPIPPALPTPSCGDTFEPPATGAPDLQLRVRLSGALPDLSSSVGVAATGDRTYTRELDDPMVVLVLDGDRVVATRDLTGEHGGSFEPFGTGEGGGPEAGPLTTCGAGEPGTLPDGDYRVVALATAVAPDGTTVQVVGEELSATVVDGFLSTPGFTAGMAELSASLAPLTRYTCDRAIPSASPATLGVAASLSGTPGPNGEVVVRTSLTNLGDGSLRVTRTPVRVQLLADGYPVMAVAGQLDGGVLGPGDGTALEVTTPVVWCLSGVDHLADREYEMRLSARVPTDGGMVDLVASGSVLVVDGAFARTVDGPVLRYPAPQPGGGQAGGDAALIEGVLELDGACLYIANDQGGGRWPVVWPAGTTWDPDAQAVVSPSGVVMPIGTAVTGEGGYNDVAAVTRLLGSDASSLAEQCADPGGQVAFVNDYDGAIGPLD